MTFHHNDQQFYPENMYTDILTGSSLNRVNDEDLCSQVNYIWTAALLSVIGLLVTMVQYVGEPIQCLCPAQLTEAQCNYTKALCWVKHNYFVHEESPIALKEEDRYELTIAYYPWIPWILFFMAAMLNVPNILWQTFVPGSGLDLKKFIFKADSHEALDNLGKVMMLWLGKRKKKDSSIVDKFQKTVGSCGLFWCGKFERSYLCGLLLFTKFSYLLITVGCFFVLGIFIEESMLTYGIDVVNDYLHGASYELNRFPIYTICDIKVRQLANIQTYSFQCILPLNMYNQKIFLFLWFWLLMISAMNAYSLVKWALYLLSYSNRWRFVKMYVTMLHHLLPRKKPRPTEDLNANSVSADGGAEADSEITLADNDTQLSPLSGARAGDENPSSLSSMPRRMRVSFSDASPTLRPRSGIRRWGARRPVSSIEADDKELPAPASQKRSISRITRKMMKEFGHDGVVVFRLLENAVGVVISNRIFQELYEQLEKGNHLS
ncbi:hypothetical protein RRG08_056682 [Elysia crispata]|uniref:Innexin n=1 Tax=Elysia crispata TaxID=231223 RepID=A0AAE1AVR4_9GAST|nr:hypothetical protein RRG08_056682 [Elysia crispata]